MHRAEFAVTDGAGEELRLNTEDADREQDKIAKADGRKRPHSAASGEQNSSSAGCNERQQSG